MIRWTLSVVTVLLVVAWAYLVRRHPCRDRAIDLQDRLMPLHQALFVESSPAPVKFAAKLLGHCEDEVRLPLVRVQPETQAKVRSAMVHAGLIN